MKKISIILFFISLFSWNTISAQQFQTVNPEEIISMQMEKIKPALDLDNLETVLMKNILLKYTKERMNLRNQNLDKEVMIEKSKEITEKQNSELTDLLSEEQLEKFKKLQEEFRNRNSNPARRPGAVRM